LTANDEYPNRNRSETGLQQQDDLIIGRILSEFNGFNDHEPTNGLTRL
jgi:hypothetical protein